MINSETAQVQQTPARFLSIERYRLPMSEPNYTPLKRCTKCGKELPATAEYFHRQAGCAMGLRPNCKVCECQRKKNGYDSEKQIEKKREYRLLYPEKAKESSRKSYRKNIDKRHISSAVYRETNHDAILQRAALRRSEYRSEVNARQRADYAKHPERYSVYFNRRRAQKRNLPDTFIGTEAYSALVYWKWKCVYCGRVLLQLDMFEDFKTQFDHFIPLSDQRPDNPGTVALNMLPVCSRCNCRKNNSDPCTWIPSRFPKKAKRIIKAIEAYFAGLRDA